MIQTNKNILSSFQKEDLVGNMDATKTLIKNRKAIIICKNIQVRWKFNPSFKILERVQRF